MQALQGWRTRGERGKVSAMVVWRFEWRLTVPLWVAVHLQRVSTRQALEQED